MKVLKIISNIKTNKDCKCADTLYNVLKNMGVQFSANVYVKMGIVTEDVYDCDFGTNGQVMVNGTEYPSFAKFKKDFGFKSVDIIFIYSESKEC